MVNFTYDPAQINDGGLNQLRFELGDVFVLEPAKTAYLADEEYLAALAGASFKRAKFRCVETLLRRFSYEVDTKVGETQWWLSDRIKAWQKLYDQLQAELAVEEMSNLRGRKMHPPIFKIGMNDWRN